MLNSLNLIMGISLEIIFVCMCILLSKYRRYCDSSQKEAIYQKNFMRDIRILEEKLPEVRLKNEGHSLDENISAIREDESVGFTMCWEGIIE